MDNFIFMVCHPFQNSCFVTVLRPAWALFSDHFLYIFMYFFTKQERVYGFPRAHHRLALGKMISTLIMTICN